MTRSRSITRNLVVTVLLLELFSAAALIGAITIHERHVQFKSFDATLLGGAQSLLGAVQEDERDEVMLDMGGVRIGRDDLFRVEDERGRVLGSAGPVPRLDTPPSHEPAFQNARIGRRTYRFVTIRGVRVIDPGMPNGGVRHEVTIACGAPVGRVWHEVVEAVRFAAIATLLLLGATAAVMIWMLRRELSPIHELANEAERINSNDWHFDAPESARITVELKPLVSALEAALARLERSFQQQRRFTSDAAHELKTDLAIVKSSLQLLLMRERTVEEYRHGLERGLDDFTRLETTVHTMLTLSRLERHAESTGSRGTTAACHLSDVLADAAQQSRAAAELKVIGMNLRAEDDATVPIDGRDALLLCSNILSNAIQHSPEGTQIWAELMRNGDHAVLTVRDQGPGIGDEDRAHLFEPFYRSDPSRSRRSGGTGLGLSICKAICEGAGGSITIENASAGGALVTVTLPVVAATKTPELQQRLSSGNDT